MKPIAVATAAFFFAFAFNCSKNAPLSSAPGPVVESGSVDSAVVDANTVFGFNLFRETAKASFGSNVVLSPLSVSMALGMVYNGAEGETKKAMEKTLEVSGLDRGKINASYATTLERLVQSDPRVVFQIANSIWALEGYPFKPAFFDVVGQYFKAEVKILDLYKPEAAGAINQWVFDKTNGKIEKIVDYKDIVANQIRMFLINALYFKGTWTYRFDEKLTTDAPFHKAGGGTVPCKMMYMRDSLRCYENGLFRAVELPYGNSHFSMLLFVPKDSFSVESLLAEFNSENYNRWIADFSKKEGKLYLPRFKLEYGRKFNDVLCALGMSIAFNEGADFSGIVGTGGPFWINDVVHKTYIEVNEEGSEAAAATVIFMVDSIATEPFVCRADRPFSFIIREKKSNAILFIGKVEEPVF